MFILNKKIQKAFEMSILSIIKTSCTIYGIFLIIFGSITNYLTCRTCLSKNLIQNPSFLFIGIIAISDTLTLLPRELDYILLDILSIGIFGNSVFGYRCRLYFTWVFMTFGAGTIVRIPQNTYQTECNVTLMNIYFNLGASIY